MNGAKFSFQNWFLEKECNTGCQMVKFKDQISKKFHI
jgi:hypothetical protein